jgi:hypothetical protein
VGPTGQRQGNKGAAAVAALTGPAQQGRKEGEGKTRAGQGKTAIGPKVRERGRMNRNPFLFPKLIFQIQFQEIFKSFWDLNKTSHHTKYNATT